MYRQISSNLVKPKTTSPYLLSGGDNFKKNWGELCISITTYYLIAQNNKKPFIYSFILL